MDTVQPRVYSKRPEPRPASSPMNGKESTNSSIPTARSWLRAMETKWQSTSGRCRLSGLALSEPRPGDVRSPSTPTTTERGKCTRCWKGARGSEDCLPGLVGDVFLGKWPCDHLPRPDARIEGPQARRSLSRVRQALV